MPHDKEYNEWIKWSLKEEAITVRGSYYSAREHQIIAYS